MIELRLLGRLSLTSADGRDVRALLGQPRRLALLAYLAAATPPGFHRRGRSLSITALRRLTGRDPGRSIWLRSVRTACNDGYGATPRTAGHSAGHATNARTRTTAFRRDPGRASHWVGVLYREPQCTAGGL